MRTRLAWACLLLLFPSTIAADDDLAALASRASVRHGDSERKVLAFYYPWYGNPEVKEGSGLASHWGQADLEKKRLSNSPDFPSLGLYDSLDAALIRRHCAWAKGAGINAFIASWWGQGTLEDQALGPLLDECQAQGMEATIYYEVVPEPITSETAAQELLGVLREHADHPAWLKVGGRPVLFVYSRAVDQLGLVGWARAIEQVNQELEGGALFIGDRLGRTAARVFDGIHTYNTADKLADKSPDEVAAWAAENYPVWVEMAESAGRISTLTLVPGYDDRPTRQPSLVALRHEGRSYAAQWEAAIKARPDWILITSFNEWHEGSEIEPSEEYGEQYLELTAQHRERFSRLRPVQEPAVTAISDEQRAALAKRLAGVRIGLLPDYESPAGWALLGIGMDVAPVTWAQVAAGVTAEQFPILVYATGEQYQRTVGETGDVDAGIVPYLKSGGLLMVLPYGPMPFYYDERKAAVDRSASFGLPLSAGGEAGGWELPPAGKRLAFSQVSERLPRLPAKLPFPTTGDLRWRPFVRDKSAPGDLVVPLLELKDTDGRHYGDAAAYIEHRASEPKNGKLLYAWFGMLDSPYGEALVFDLLSFAADRVAGTQ